MLALPYQWYGSASIIYTQEGSVTLSYCIPGAVLAVDPRRTFGRAHPTSSTAAMETPRAPLAMSAMILAALLAAPIVSSVTALPASGATTDDSTKKILFSSTGAHSTEDSTKKNKFSAGAHSKHTSQTGEHPYSPRLTSPSAPSRTDLRRTPSPVSAASRCVTQTYSQTRQDQPPPTEIGLRLSDGPSPGSRVECSTMVSGYCVR